MNKSVEELKTTLKTLFVEKKKVKDLEKKLELMEFEKNDLRQEISQLASKDPEALTEIVQERLQEKFFQKLKDTQKEHDVKEKDEEIYNLKKQLMTVKPTLKKVVDELKRAREQIEQLSQEKETLYQEKQERIAQLEEELKTLKDKLFQETPDKSESQASESPTGESQTRGSLNSELRLRQLQQHLAKKMKEETLLRDLVERQKSHFVNMQHTIDQQVVEINQLQNHLQMQHLQEEKRQEMMKIQLQTTEQQFLEWQERCNDLQKKLQEAKSQIAELQKIKDRHEELTEKVALLKSHFAKSFEILYPPSKLPVNQMQDATDLRFDE